MNKKEIQTNRMLTYFIDATAQIIEKEGFQNITIRKIADIAGYNSATIYNYFGEVSHLIFFAAMKFLKTYTDDLPRYLVKGKTHMEKYFLCWECFCKHSFEDSQLFHTIFISDLGEHPKELMKRYYTLYHNDLIDLPEDWKPVMLEANIFKRNLALLEKCVEDGIIERGTLETINEMTILMWKATLTDILNNRKDYSPAQATAKIMRYIKQIWLWVLTESLETQRENKEEAVREKTAAYLRQIKGMDYPISL